MTKLTTEKVKILNNFLMNKYLQMYTTAYDLNFIITSIITLELK